MPMFPSVSLLHAQVAAKMRAKELKAGVGALVFTSIAEMTERGRPTNDGINNLRNDIRNTLVYVDPALARADAKNAHEASAEYATSNPPLAAVLETLATGLENDATISEKRAALLKPEMTQQQIDFSTSFFRFRQKWETYYASVQNGSAFDNQSGNDVADTIDTYYDQYRNYFDGYTKLGFKPTIDAPAKSKVGDTLPDVPKVVANISNAIPWTQIGLFVGGALAVYWFINRRPAEPTLALPERRVGPPDHHDSEEAALSRAHL